MRRAVWYRSRASRPRHASSSENEYIPLLRGARRRRCLIDLCLLDFFLYLGGAAATGVARFPVSVTVLGLVGRVPGGKIPRVAPTHRRRARAASFITAYLLLSRSASANPRTMRSLLVCYRS